MRTNRQVYFSDSIDPFINLSLEDQLFRSADLPLLFLYVNQPCVVMGRHQNPWIECDLAGLRRDAVPLLRRQSGGGTVYHDLGNLNWCFMSEREDYDPDRNFACVVDALLAAGVAAALSTRKDIIVEGRKVSGSAYKVGKERCLHHGTLLVAADLSRLTRYLQAPKRSLESKGIDSVRSRVANLNEFLPDLGTRGAMEMLSQGYTSTGMQMRSLDDFDQEGAEYVRELKHWDWLYGKTPDFIHRMPCSFSKAGGMFELDIHRGLVRSAQLTSSGDTAKSLLPAHALSGCRYEAGCLMAAINSLPSVSGDLRGALRELIQREVECL